MNNERLYLRILSLGLIVILSGTFTFCSDNVTEQSTHLVYTVEGISKEVQSITGVLQMAVQYDHIEQAMVITASNSFSDMLTIKVANWDFQTPPENGVLEKEYDATYDAEQGESHSPHVECIELTGDNAGVFLCDYGLITLMLEGELYTSVFTGNEDGTIIITECNPDKKSVSGSFDAKVQTSIGKKVKVSGTFTNVKYTVF